MVSSKPGVLGTDPLRPSPLITFWVWSGADLFRASPDLEKSGAASPAVLWFRQTCLTTALTSSGWGAGLWRLPGFSLSALHTLSSPALAEIPALLGFSVASFNSWTLGPFVGVTQGGPRDLLKPDLDAGRCLVHVQRPTRGPEKRQLRHGLQFWTSPFVGRRLCRDLAVLCLCFSNYGLVPVNEHPARASAPRPVSATRTSDRGLLCPVSRRQPHALPPAALFPAARYSRVVFLRGLLAWCSRAVSSLVVFFSRCFLPCHLQGYLNFRESPLLQWLR